MNKILLGTLLSIFTFSASANVVINTTRVIYPAEKKEVSVQLLNTGENPSLVQAWIDDGDANSTPETARVPFLLTPPVVKVEGKNGQQLRIKFTQGNLPQNHESIFYLNVLDIPPVADDSAGKNVMQIAVRSRIKLFYRPAGLTMSAKEMDKHIQLVKTANGVKINNPTPYYLNLVGITASGLKPNLLDDGLVIAPGAEKSVTANIPNNIKQFTLVMIDDFGSLNKFTVTSQ
ncbi:fimbrial biogenesis chaperone [Klebsiella aerogenes]|uniref:fimbrial biogenesis chaperone n=1 Tax=Klebsiella aerogenes TaxID=548 RepID=UPI0032DBB8A8